MPEPSIHCKAAAKSGAPVQSTTGWTKECLWVYEEKPSSTGGEITIFKNYNTSKIVQNDMLGGTINKGTLPLFYSQTREQKLSSQVRKLRPGKIGDLASLLWIKSVLKAGHPVCTTIFLHCLLLGAEIVIIVFWGHFGGKFCGGKREEFHKLTPNSSPLLSNNKGT